MRKGISRLLRFVRRQLPSFIIGTIVAMIALCLYSQALTLELQHLFFDTNEDERATTILSTVLESRQIKPHYGISPLSGLGVDQRTSKLADKKTLGSARQAVRALGLSGYKARLEVIPVEGKKLILVESNSLPAHALIFKDSWTWLEVPAWRRRYVTRKWWGLCN